MIIMRLRQLKWKPNIQSIEHRNNVLTHDDVCAIVADINFKRSYHAISPY